MTDVKKGLTEQEVRQRVSKGLVNTAVKSQSKSVGQIIAGNVFTYFNLIFAVFFALLLLVRSYVNMTFLPIIISNTLIGIVQEIRSKRVLDRLNVMHAGKTSVIRDGQISQVDSQSLVKDDLCIFEAGKQVSADALIVGGSVRVNEALITGEADEITKNEGDVLYSGSFIVSGSCRAVLQNVGLDSFAAKLMLEAKASRKKQQTEMMRSLDKLVKVIGIIIIPIGILLYFQHRFILHLSIQESVVSMIASLVGMIPEGLYLLASMALVVSVMRLGKKQVLVHEMACVETLARVNVLCVDKTGTITENAMAVQKVAVAQDFCERDVYLGIGDVTSALSADNITMQTLKAYFTASAGKEPLKVYPFSSETKYSAVTFSDGTYVIGAPENVLLDDYAQHEPQIMEYVRAGMRVLVYGKYDGAIQKEQKALEKPVELYAYILICNPIRKEAAETFDYFRRQGVKIKVISGDNPQTASYIAAEAGIERAEKYIDVSSLNDGELEDAAGKYTVFGRVSPQQKKKLIQAMKGNSNVVAMTGDGVNDVLALKAADCSIALASGSEAASNAAQIVLLDSDFSKMPSVVLEGRRVVNNIQRSASLFLVKNIFSILITLFTLISVNMYPLYPTQLSFLGTFTIGTPAFLLAMQPNRSRIQGHFLTNVVIQALPAALTDFIMLVVLTLIGSAVGVPHEQLSTMCIMVLVTVGFAALMRISLPFDKFRMCVCVCMLLGIVFSVIFLRPLFALYDLPTTLFLCTGIAMAVSIPLYRYVCVFVFELTRLLAKHNDGFRKKLMDSFFRVGSGD
jgi:cation-transporting ATPase E